MLLFRFIYFSAMSFVYDTEQREIIERLGRACDTIVQGFAGTSKTVLANGGGLHAAKNTVVIYTASTGKAAQGLNDSFHTCGGSFLPRLFPIPAMTTARFVKDVALRDALVAKADAGVPFTIAVAVDEFAMLSLSLYEQLHCWRERFARFPNACIKFWLFGDYSQLQSPGEASLFYSTSFRRLTGSAIGATPKLQILLLTNLYRFKCDEYEAFVRDLSFARRPREPDEATMRRLWRVCHTLQSRTINHATLMPPRIGASGTTKITYTNKGVNAFNDRALKTLWKHGNTLYCLFNERDEMVLKLCVGSRAIGTHNMYENRQLKLANGESVTVDAVTGTEVQHASMAGLINAKALRMDKDLDVFLIKADGEDECTIKPTKVLLDDGVTKSPLMLPLQLCDATTVHKRQGDTIDPAVGSKVVLDITSCPTWEALYVMLTRCQYLHQLYVEPFDFTDVVRLFFQKQDSKVRSFAKFVGQHGIRFGPH